MKRAVVIAGVLVLAAAAVGAVVLTMNASPKDAAVHADHDHDHAGHTHGPNGECPLDPAKAVGVEEVAPKAAPVSAPAKPGA